jgi:hypothetical protein
MKILGVRDSMAGRASVPHKKLCPCSKCPGARRLGKGPALAVAYGPVKVVAEIRDS